MLILKITQKSLESFKASNFIWLEAESVWNSNKSSLWARAEPELEIQIHYSQVRNKLLLLADPNQHQINRYFLWSTPHDHTSPHDHISYIWYICSINKILKSSSEIWKVFDKHVENVKYAKLYIEFNILPTPARACSGFSNLSCSIVI